MSKVTPCIWFDHQAEEALAFYTSVFKNSRVGEIARYSEAGPGEQGSVMTATFFIEDQEFMLLNGGPFEPITAAISLFVHCANQAEVDDLWEKLSKGGEEEQCGWVKDRFGVSWQIVPTRLGELLSDPDPEKVLRVTQAMLKMKKLDIETLERA